MLLLDIAYSIKKCNSLQKIKKKKAKEGKILLVFPKIQIKFFKAFAFKAWEGIYKVVFLTGKNHHLGIYY